MISDPLHIWRIVIVLFSPNLHFLSDKGATGILIAEENVLNETERWGEIVVGSWYFDSPPCSGWLNSPSINEQ